MRTIKFRGRSRKTGEWLVGDLLQVANEVFIAPSDGDWFDFIPWSKNNVFHLPSATYEVIPDTVGQFTGLLDKNGKEIYEGDILRGNEYPFNCDGVDNYFAEIVWADNVCGFYRITHKNPQSCVRGISHGNWSELDDEDAKSFEVIGNIHDNPELLKQND